MGSSGTTSTTSEAERRARLAKTIVYFSLFIALGMGGVTLGPTLQGLASHTHARLNEISIVFSARALGYMLGSFVAGRLYDRTPGHPVIASVLIGMGIMLFLTPVIPVLWLLVVVLVLLGIAEGGVDVGGNTMIVWTHGSQVGPYMNGLHFFWGVGAFLSPIIIAQAVLLSGDITLGYWLIALLMAPPVIGLLHLPSPMSHTHAGDRPTGPINVKLVVLILAFFALYVGAEGTFGGWIFTYAVALGQSNPTTAALLTSVFWGSLTLGRLFSIPIATRFQPSTVLLGDLIGCLASIALILALPQSSVIIWIGTFGAGLFMASMFPTMLSYAERRLALTGQLTGLFLVTSAAGGMTLPWLVGQLFDVVGPRVTIFMAFASVAICTATFIAIRLSAVLPTEAATVQTDTTVHVG